MFRIWKLKLGVVLLSAGLLTMGLACEANAKVAKNVNKSGLKEQ